MDLPTKEGDTMSLDDLVALGFSAELAPRVQAYVDALNDCDAKGPGLSHGGRYAHFFIENRKTGKYVRVVMDTNPGSNYGRSVHAFIVKESGQVVKPAGWTGPAKGTGKNNKGQLLSKFTLADDVSFSSLLSLLDTTPSAWSGGYLYQ
jgi:hypothetical protein